MSEKFDYASISDIISSDIVQTLCANNFVAVTRNTVLCSIMLAFESGKARVFDAENAVLGIFDLNFDLKDSKHPQNNLATKYILQVKASLKYLCLV